jgi:hypothetical protein
MAQPRRSFSSGLYLFKGGTMSTVPISLKAKVSPVERKKVTTLAFRQRKSAARHITMLTAYDYPTALAVDAPGSI